MSFEWSPPGSPDERAGLFKTLYIRTDYPARATIEHFVCLKRIRAWYADDGRKSGRSVCLTHPRQCLASNRRVLSVDKHKINLGSTQ
jgi:hypothetical protein